jgi:AcrR family transcriptional regulator
MEPDRRDNRAEQAAPRGRPFVLSNENRRRVLIDAAEVVFVRSGYHTATMDDVAHQAGMSKKTVYQIFPAKAALFEALVGERLAVMAQPLVDDSCDPIVAITDFMTVVATTLLSPGLLAITRLMITDTPRSPEITDTLKRQLSFNALERFLCNQQACGRITIDDPQEVAGMFFGTVMGDLTIKLLLNLETPPTPERIRNRVERATQIFFRGIRAKGVA